MIFFIKFVCSSFSAMTNDNFLNPKIIEDFLKPDIKQSIPCIQVFSEVGSTNDIMINEMLLQYYVIEVKDIWVAYEKCKDKIFSTY